MPSLINSLLNTEQDHQLLQTASKQLCSSSRTTVQPPILEHSSWLIVVHFLITIWPLTEHAQFKMYFHIMFFAWRKQIRALLSKLVGL